MDREKSLFIIFALALLLCSIILVSCAQKKNRCGRATPIATQNPTAIAPECFGLFVEMKGHLNDYEEKFDGSPYVFEKGEPMTVTASVLMFGPGQLILAITSPFEEYTFTIVNEDGQTIAITDAGEKIRTAQFRRIGGISVEKNTPFVESLPIGEWFDFSEPGSYTLTLTRRVYISSMPYDIEGNPVTILIWPDQ